MPWKPDSVDRGKGGGESWQYSRLTSCGGYCRRCGRVHYLGQSGARQAGHSLMVELEREKRIDFHLPQGKANPLCATDSLFGSGRGKMFGVLVCEESGGRQVVVRAYSGQYNGEWTVDGWAPPILDPLEFYRVTWAAEKEIKRLGRRLERYDPLSSVYRELAGKRKRLSRETMREIFNLYTFHNFRGERRRLGQVYLGTGLPPTGTGDCCAPKLLHYAASNGLKPKAIAEFFWGRENTSQSRQHGVFYPACASKCQPILGFLLCGSCQDDS